MPTNKTSCPLARLVLLQNIKDPLKKALRVKIKSHLLEISSKILLSSERGFIAVSSCRRVVDNTENLSILQ